MGLHLADRLRQDSYLRGHGGPGQTRMLRFPRLRPGRPPPDNPPSPKRVISCSSPHASSLHQSAARRPPPTPTPGRRDVHSSPVRQSDPGPAEHHAAEQSHPRRARPGRERRRHTRTGHRPHLGRGRSDRPSRTRRRTGCSRARGSRDLRAGRKPGVGPPARLPTGQTRPRHVTAAGRLAGRLPGRRPVPTRWRQSMTAPQSRRAADERGGLTVLRARSSYSMMVTLYRSSSRNGLG